MSEVLQKPEVWSVNAIEAIEIVVEDGVIFRWSLSATGLFMKLSVLPLSNIAESCFPPIDIFEVTLRMIWVEQEITELSRVWTAVIEETLDLVAARDWEDDLQDFEKWPFLLQL